MVIIGFIDEDVKRQAIYDEIDYYFVIIYIIEFAMKIIALGILAYYRDNWNKIDFGLIIISLTTDFAFSMFKVIRNARTIKATRIARINKTYRLMRVIRSFRVAVGYLVFQVPEENHTILLQASVEREEVHSHDFALSKSHLPNDDHAGHDFSHLRLGWHDNFQHRLQHLLPF